jgi:hypothetical protein
LRYDVEWSLQPSFASFSSVACGERSRLTWMEPLGDGDIFWRVRVTDATGLENRSEVRQLHLQRTVALALRATTPAGSASMLLGARAGAAAGFVDGEDLPRPATTGPACWSQLEAHALAVDWRALPMQGSDGFEFHVRVHGAANALATLEATTWVLPNGYQARLLNIAGKPLGAFTAVGDRSNCRLDANGDAALVLRVRIPHRDADAGGNANHGAGDAGGADAGAATDASASQQVSDSAPGAQAVWTPSQRLRLGSRIQLASTDAGRSAFQLYDVRGRRLRSGTTRDDGTWTWDGRDGSGNRLATGVYFVRAEPRAATRVRPIKLLWLAR